MADVNIVGINYFPGTSGELTGNFELIFENSTTTGTDRHLVPEMAFVDRAARYGYDPGQPDFHGKLLRHFLHEAYTEAPPHIKRRPDYVVGQLTSLDVAERVNQWHFREEHLNMVRSKVRIRSHHLTGYTASMPPGFRDLRAN